MSWVIVILVIVAILVFILFCVRYVKRKIRNKIIDVGADILTKTTEKVLDEETASKVNNATSIAAETLKKGSVMTVVAKKGFEIAMDAKKSKANSQKEV